MMQASILIEHLKDYPQRNFPHGDEFFKSIETSQENDILKFEISQKIDHSIGQN